MYSLHDVFLSCQLNHMFPHCISFTSTGMHNKQVTNQLNTVQLSGGDRKMSVLTKLKYYYQSIWALFINTEIDVPLVGQREGGMK